MRVLLVVSSSKHTGAAAVAELCCRALRAVGVEARLLFVAGNNLQLRLELEAWALPGLVKERLLSDLRRNLAAIRSAVDGTDVIVCHLPHDHLLCVLAGVHRHATLVRSFRQLGHLRTDPFHRRLGQSLSGALLAHAGLESRLRRVHGQLPSRPFPVPLEDRFRPGADPLLWRRRLAIPAAAPVLGMVGKVAPGRGFELLLECAARIPPPVYLLAVGHGEAQVALQSRAERLGLADHLAWAGFQERELPELYAAMDVVLFAAAGSDHGHRTISEAQGCGRPVVAAAIPGVEELVEDGRTGRVTRPVADELARAVTELIADPTRAQRLARAGHVAAEQRRLSPSGEKLGRFLDGLARVARSKEDGCAPGQP